MGKFFNKLVSEKLYCEWAEVLDWLFDDLKFSKERNWNGGYTSSFTKKIKKLRNYSINDKQIVYGKIDHKTYPNQQSKIKKRKEICIMMSNKDSFARDLIRHIRNGIAHGESSIYQVKDELYIEIIDYANKTKKLDKQTAYLYIPLSDIVEFHKIYDGINKSIMNTKKKDRKATNKYKR